MDMEFFRGKKILITGHTGFKGSWLSKILLMYGADVLGYSLTPTVEPSMYKLLNLETQLKCITDDVKDFKKLKNTIMDFKPEIIFHLAAQAINYVSNEQPLNTYETNVLGTVNLMEAIRGCDSIKSVINVSTDTVYLKKETKENYAEHDEIKGNNPYSNSKCCAENIVENYKQCYFKCKDYPRISTTRSVNIIGGGDFNNSRIIPECISSWINNQNIEVRNPKNVRPFLHVLEVLYGYLLLAKLQYEDVSFEGTYNFAPDEDGYIDIGQIVSIFCEKVNNKIRWIDTSCEKRENNLIYKIDNRKAKEKLHWDTNWSVEERIEKIVEWNESLLKKENINAITEKQIFDFFGNV